MSLINEALKKAQRQRTEVAAEIAGVPGGMRASRGPARGPNSIMLLGAGAVALVAVSVGITIYLVNRPAATAAPPATTSRLPATAVKSESPVTSAVPPPISEKPAVTVKAPVGAAPVSIVPGGPRPAAALPPAPSVPPAAAVTAGTAPTGVRPAVPVAAATASAPPAAVAAPATISSPPLPAAAPPIAERINAFIDTMRISGVKPAGVDSRILMNDRVYRVNDIVERNLQLRLLKVESTHLTFTDASGAMYVKYF